MSKEIKMSDMFYLPLQAAVNELAIIDNNDVVVGWAAAFSGESARDYFIESINNHDRLVEENKRLIDMLKRLTSHDNCKKDVIHLMSEAESLLSELGGE